MSSIRLIWLKMSTREPFSFMLLKSLSRMTILPPLWIKCSSVVYGGPGSAPSKRYGWQVTLRSLKTHQSDQRLDVEMIETNLHDDVHQPRLAFLATSQAIDCVDILLEDRAIPLPLHIRQANVDVDLNLCSRGIKHS